MSLILNSNLKYPAFMMPNSKQQLQVWPVLAILCLVMCGAYMPGFAQEAPPSHLTDDEIINKLNLPDPLEAGWEGESVCTVLESNDKLRVLKCVFPSGVGHIKHYHRPHTGYTLAGGTFQMTDSRSTRTLEVPTGTVFGSDVLTVHEVLNVGQTTGEFLIIEPKE